MSSPTPRRSPRFPRPTRVSSHEGQEKEKTINHDNGKRTVWLDLNAQMTLCFEVRGSRWTAHANLVKYPDGIEVKHPDGVQLSECMSSNQIEHGGMWSVAAKAAHDMVGLKSTVKQLLIELARRSGLGDQEARQALLTSSDFTGAGVLHCLLLSNKPEAMDLALEMVKLEPKLLHVTHVENGSKNCLFKGEGALHIAAVNQQEEWILSALEVAWQDDKKAVFGKSDSQLEIGVDNIGLLEQTCEGRFFDRPPMSHLGGTALAYCAAFNNARVLRWVAQHCDEDRKKVELFHQMRPKVKGHSRPDAYTVMHAVVVNGAQKSYEALNKFPCAVELDAGGLPRMWPVSTRSSVVSEFGLSPLRLAAKEGNSKMFEHILWSTVHDRVMWKWGPVTQYTIPLGEIDTAGVPGRQQVLDLVADDSAKPESHGMLSDDVLNGLLFYLIKDKWLRWGSTFFWGVYMWPKVLHTLLLTSLAAPSILEYPAVPLHLSSHNGDLYVPWHRTADGEVVIWCLQVSVLSSSSYLLLLELFEAILTVRNFSRCCEGSARRSPLSRRMHHLVRYWRSCCDRYGWIQYVGLPSSLAACVLLLSSSEPTATRESEVVCVLLSLSVLSAWVFTALELLCWNKDIGIFNVIVGSMLGSDVLRFLLLYFPMLLGFATAFTALFPNVSTDIRTGSAWSMVENLIILSLVGEPPEVSLPGGGGTIFPTVAMWELQSGRPFNATLCEWHAHPFALSAFLCVLHLSHDASHRCPSIHPSCIADYVLFLLFLVLVLVLLLNLLIAMMGKTYQQTMEDATLRWRIKFARLILRLELLASHAPTSLGTSVLLSRAVRDPTHWPPFLAFGIQAKHAQQSYIQFLGDPVFAFRTYDQPEGQTLILEGSRGDPFRREASVAASNSSSSQLASTRGGGAMPDTGAPHASGAPLAAGAPSAENMRELAAAIRSDTNASAPGRDAILGHLRSALALLTGDHDAKEPTDHAATTATKGPLAGRRWASSARAARADQRAKDNAEKLLGPTNSQGLQLPPIHRPKLGPGGIPADDAGWKPPPPLPKSAGGSLSTSDALPSVAPEEVNAKEARCATAAAPASPRPRSVLVTMPDGSKRLKSCSDRPGVSL